MVYFYVCIGLVVVGLSVKLILNIISIKIIDDVAKSFLVTEERCLEFETQDGLSRSRDLTRETRKIIDRVVFFNFSQIGKMIGLLRIRRLLRQISDLWELEDEKPRRK